MSATPVPPDAPASPARRQQQQKLSILRGPSDPPLLDLTLGDLLDLQTIQHGLQECIVIPWTGARWTYNDLSAHSSALARGLGDRGIGIGDRVAVMAGNCEQYAALFFAVAKIGAILVILNNSYTPDEAMHALRFTGSKMFFTTRRIGRLDNAELLKQLGEDEKAKEEGGKPKVVMLRGGDNDDEAYETYDQMIRAGPPRLDRDSHPKTTEVSGLLPHQVVNLQFTSGTTGHPKAAMLTHHNLVNNAKFIGDRMRLTPSDVLCCPPPLFHCFGLVLGLLAALTHGAKIVYPAEVFDAAATLRALHAERCTALHGVPAMFEALFDAAAAAAAVSPADLGALHLRTGIVAGAPVPRDLMRRMVRRLGMREFTSSYGLTEAAPTCFNAFTDDGLACRLRTVGKLMPHAHAKIVDRRGVVVPLGVRGELCVAGYQLQDGYWNNEEKTREVMVPDAAGVVWLHTGDEAVFDEDGYCSITGRFKDIIIRGGENIYPLEIEERLTAHPSISRAVVVGLKDTRYGEVVGAFVEHVPQRPKPDDQEIRNWVLKSLGKYKAPTHVFWLGHAGVPTSVPLTGSGKVKKYEMARLGQDLLSKMRQESKL